MATGDIVILKEQSNGSLKETLLSTPFVMSVATSQATPSAATMWINGMGNSGYAPEASFRLRKMLQACTVTKVFAMTQQSVGQTDTASNGSISLYNSTTNTTYPIFSGNLATEATGSYVNHAATSLSIPLAENDLFVFKMEWPGTIPTDMRVILDVYCYASKL